MITTFKESPSGSFYCTECRMAFGEPYTTCPYCGSIVSNYQTLISQDVLTNSYLLEDEETQQKILTMFKEKLK